MAKIEKIEKRVDEVNNLANLVAERANKDILLLKHKVTCLTVLVVLFAILGACIALYSIHSMKELFYEVTTEEQYIDVDSGDNGNATGIIGDNNEVNN